MPLCLQTSKDNGAYHQLVRDFLSATSKEWRAYCVSPWRLACFYTRPSSLYKLHRIMELPTGYRVALVFLVCWVMTPVEANYTLEIRLTGYQNPTHMAADQANRRQGCCDFDPALPCESCETAISICVRERITDEVSGACGLLKLESNETGGDDEDLVFTDDIGGLSNPIIVSGDMWKGTLEVLFTIYDLDGTSVITDDSSDIVDNIFAYPEIDAVSSRNEPFSDVMSYTGIHNFSHLQLAFRLTCGQDHYGPDCTRCVEADNDVAGHYSCDNATGERRCLEGYQNPLTFCLDCIPADNCSTEGGYCSQPGDCLCLPGFSGDNCDDSPCDSQPCSNAGTCSVNTSSVLNYTCTCVEGFTGDQCQNMTSDLTPFCDPPCINGHCVNESCECDDGYTGTVCEVMCDVECGRNGKCVEEEEEDRESGFMCECDDGYTGEFCDTITTTPDSGSSGGGSDNMLVVIVVVVVGGVLVVLIAAVLIAICILLFRGHKMKRSDNGHTPNPYETPFFRRWRGNGHTSNGLATERKFENPLYHESPSVSPTSPPLPPRPADHSYATLEDINNPYAQIPAELELDQKPMEAVPLPDPPTAANPYDHIGPQSPHHPSGELSAAPQCSLGGPSSTPRAENPYLSPLNSVRPDNPMDSSSDLYAHIQ